MKTLKRILEETKALDEPLRQIPPNKKASLKRDNSAFRILYSKYIRDRYHSDEKFREAILERNKRHYKKIKEAEE